jgi:thiamine monophosphate synthase
MLSPIFENSKYSPNKILNIVKFNNISNRWKENVVALGGINLKNISRLRMMKIWGIGFKRFMSGLKNRPFK